MPYKTIKLSVLAWKDYATARRITVDRGLTAAEARQRCNEFNKNRTPAQIRRGTRLEYTDE